MQLISSLFKIPINRWAKLLIGLASLGLSVALMKQANLGLGPWDVLSDGLAQIIGIQLGAVSVLVGAIVLLFWIPIRERPGAATVASILLIGAFTDIALAVVQTPSSVLLQSVWLIAGLLLAGLGSVLYLGSQLGAGPRDGLMLGLSRRTGWSLRLSRTGLEVSVLIIGWLLGGVVGVGTVVFALGIGPGIEFISRLMGEELEGPNRSNTARRFGNYRPVGAERCMALAGCSSDT